jgi:CRISPR/Cas system type I-B associated protein Csh2 (Cas7 group RAMP superfamily)
MAGKKVHVKGIIEEKAGKKWLNIIEYKAVFSKSGKGKHKK